MNILIAENENILSGILKEEFETEGFRVIVAHNGNEALELLKSKSDRPDIVLLDLLMPFVDGFQVLEEIQKDQIYNLKSIPVIVLSGLGQDEDVKKAMKLGAVDYFIKTKHPIYEVIEKVKYLMEKGSYREK